MKRVIHFNRNKIIILLKETSFGTFGVNQRVAELTADALIRHEVDIIEEINEEEKGDDNV